MVAKIAFRPGVHIGEPAAEDDGKLLSACFVNLPIMEQLRDMESSKCVILGRTGSGKTALLNHIFETSSHAIRIDPKDIAFDYIANSNIVSFLSEIGCDLSVLFQLLWKHILCTKAIKCYFDNRNIFTKAIDSVFDKDNPIKTYFDRYEDQFWVQHDESLREISGGFENVMSGEIKAALGADFAKIEAGSSASLSITGSQKKEIISRTKRAVSNLQIRELSRAIDALNDIMDNRQKQYFVVVDDLDLDWADNKIKYGLIRSLIDAAKSFRKIRNVKVLIALRSDLYERALLTDDYELIQPEKYEGLTCEIKWTSIQLKDVVDKRISYIMKNVYTKQGVGFSDVFPDYIRKSPTFDYFVERTLFRPRDMIAFINVVLDRAAASGSVTVSPKTITDSEAEYSKKRHDALCREWAILHPHLKIYLGFLQGKTGRNDFSDIATREIIQDVCLNVDEAQQEGQHKDSVVTQCEIYSKRENPSKLREVAANLLAVLYKAGAVELKLSKGDIYRACFRNEPVILPDQIGLDAAFIVSPMLWRSLGITPNLG